MQAEGCRVAAGHLTARCPDQKDGELRLLTEYTV
jgi:hypothetical protein